MFLLIPAVDLYMIQESMYRLTRVVLDKIHRAVNGCVCLCVCVCVCVCVCGLLAVGVGVSCKGI